MRHRIFVSTLEGVPATIEVVGAEFHHASRVVRLRKGEEVEVFDGKGMSMRGEVSSLEPNRLVVELLERADPRESDMEVVLACALIQTDRFETVLQKGCELGVHSFIPLLTDRVELRPERAAGKMDRWRKIILEAVKQSGRSRIPGLDGPAPYDEVIAREGTKFLFDADENPTLLPPSISSVTLFIGPEGGWSEREIEAARRAGAHFQRMGPRRLRAETAAITAIALIQSRFGDLGDGRQTL